jgi:uncharacterized protein YndB with AHSA1/START domain
VSAVADYATSIEIAAAPSAVFEYLVTADGMTAWMGQHAELDPSVGGLFAVDIQGYPVRGEYLELDPPHRAVVSWGFAGSDDLPPGHSRVEFTLTAIPSGTRVDLVHSNLPETRAASHGVGWAHFLDRLARAAAGEVLAPDEWMPGRTDARLGRMRP